MGLAVPTDAGEVSASWMEAALSALPGSLSSCAVEQMAEAGLAGRMFRAHLDWIRPADLPRAVIVKLSPLGDEWRTDRALSNMLLREVRFYNEFGANPGVAVPTLFHAAVDETNLATVLVMEDLAADTMYRPGEAPELAVEAVARSAARFHARHWGAEGPAWLARFGSDESAEWARIAAPEVARAIAREHPDLVPLVHAWPGALSAGALAPKPRTVVHGDLGLRNVAFRRGRPVIFDWQQVGLGDPAYDVLQLVNEAANGREPSATTARVFAAYLEEFASAGGGSYGADELWADARVGVLLRAGTVIFRVATAPVRTSGHLEIMRRWVGLLRWWRDTHGLPDLA